MSHDSTDAANLRLSRAQLPSPLRARRATKYSGFTIMELAVVVMVMGILAAAAAPSFYSSLQYQELKTAARRLVFDLEQVRQSARLQSSQQALTFTSDTGYRLSGVKSLNRLSENYTVDLAGTPFHMDNVTLALDNATSNQDGELEIAFDGYGYSATRGQILLFRGNRKCTVTVDGPTGKISHGDPIDL